MEPTKEIDELVANSANACESPSFIHAAHVVPFILVYAEAFAIVQGVRRYPVRIAIVETSEAIDITVKTDAGMRVTFI